MTFSMTVLPLLFVAQNASTSTTATSTLTLDVDAATVDVVISGVRARPDVTRRILEREALVRVPGTLGDPVLAVENLPGVARTGDGSTVVRGSSPRDSMATVDGVPVLIETHFGGYRSVLAAPLVDRIELLPGNYSVRHGRRTGGIVDVKLRSLAGAALHGELELGMLDASIYVEVPIGEEAGIALAARRSHIDLLLDAALSQQGSGVRVVAAPRWYDYQLLAEWRPTDTQTLSLFVLGSSDAMNLVLSEATPGSTATSSALVNDTEFQRVTLTHEVAPFEGVEHELRVALGRDAQDFDAMGLFTIDAEIRSLTVRDALRVRAAEGVSVSAGLDLLHRRVDYSLSSARLPLEGDPGGGLPGEKLVGVGSDVPFTELAGWIEGDLALGGGVTIVPGARVDYFSQVGEVSFDPRLVVRWRPEDTLTLKAGAGLVHQAPELQETEAPFGNPDLGLISAAQYSVGAEWRPLELFSAELTLFQKELRGLVSSTDAIAVRDGVAAPVVYDNAGEGRVRGLELMLKKESSGGLAGWLAYTLSRSERVDRPGEEARLFDYDQTHILTLVASYVLADVWTLGLRFRLVSGRPVTPLVGGIFRADEDQYEAIPGAPSSARLPAFHQLDLRVDRSWKFEDWTLSAYASVTNVYDRTNVESIGYNFDYSKQQNVGGLPLLPIVGIKGSF